MANRVTAITITTTGWTKILTGTAAQIWNNNTRANYRIRILAAGDTAPTSAIEKTDLPLFRTITPEEIEIATSADIYCRCEGDIAGEVLVLV